MIEELLRANLSILSTQEVLIKSLASRLRSITDRIILVALVNTHLELAKTSVLLFDHIIRLRRRGVFTRPIDPADYGRARAAMILDPTTQPQLF